MLPPTKLPVEAFKKEKEKWIKIEYTGCGMYVVRETKNVMYPTVRLEVSTELEKLIARSDTDVYIYDYWKSTRD
jgi:hypothetical protein